MAGNLVIVESPAKARTLSHILGSQYSVKASRGHIRDLPKKGLGVDIKKAFQPQYVVPQEKRRVIKELQEALSQASSLYLATDPDREGEAIAWHLTQVLKLDNLPVHRVECHEITPESVKASFRSPRPLDLELVEAQQARRILDRLVGYRLSPLLWRKVRGGLSAGRVQSAALRLVVDREKEIQGFIPREYWSIEAELKKLGGEISFLASLVTGKEIPNQREAERLASELQGARFRVKEVAPRELSRQPPPPFITSTLQQEAARKLGFSPERTMVLAQQLYEGLEVGKEGRVGLITYMRTDSTRVAASALAEVREFITQHYEPSYLPPRARFFRQKVKGAQEAHEAIRPTKVWREPSSLKPYLNPDQLKLYDLIWRRMVASQMEAAKYRTLTVNILARVDGQSYPFRATSSQLLFPGFMVLYVESRDEEEEGAGPGLPPLSPGEELELVGISPQQHFTQPPPRYTEASLIRALEERGIGRPSTYAPTLATIKDRGYVERKGGRLYPHPLGMAVSDLLSQHFPRILDLGFTAQMEERLDAIARGEVGMVPVLEDFYLPFSQELEEASQKLPRIKVEAEPSGQDCPVCGKPMVIKQGRFGKFLSCSDFPRCRAAQPYMVKLGIPCPLCGGELVERENRQRRIFYGCSKFPECKFVSNARPLLQPCPQCGGLMTLYRSHLVRCSKCSHRSPLTEAG